MINTNDIVVLLDSILFSRNGRRDFESVALLVSFAAAHARQQEIYEPICSLLERALVCEPRKFWFKQNVNSPQLSTEDSSLEDNKTKEEESDELGRLLDQIRQEKRSTHEQDLINENHNHNRNKIQDQDEKYIRSLDLFLLVSFNNFFLFF